MNCFSKWGGQYSNNFFSCFCSYSLMLNMISSNDRPISTLSNFSKIFQKLIYTQINSIMEPKLPKYLAVFRKNHNTQHALLKMIETWRYMPSKNNKVWAIVMDLSKAFDTPNYILFCKLKSYGFDKNALTFFQSYFSNRHQRTKLGDKFSKWQKISRGVS